MPNATSTRRRKPSAVKATSRTRSPRKGTTRSAGAHKAQADDERVSARHHWSGTLSFGLVSIPVDLVAATHRKRAPLRMLNSEGTPLSRRFFVDEREVKAKELSRGYEIAKGQYVVISDEELRALDPERSRDINLQTFVEAAQISPLYFERAYFLVPGRGANKAYGLLSHVMEKTRRVGIARFVMHDAERVIAIYASDGVLHGQTLRFNNEVRAPDTIDAPSKSAANVATIHAMEKALDAARRRRFTPQQLTQDATDKLIALAKTKERKGTDVVEVDPQAVQQSQPMADVIDLMEALKQSLNDSKTKAAR